MRQSEILAIGLVCLLVVFVQNGSAFQCYRCSYNVLQSEGLVGTFLSFFNNLAADEHCKLEKEGDLTEIGIRNCPQEEGKVAKCSAINGVVTTTIDVAIIGQQEFKYHTVTRDCVLVDPNDEEYTDGCHEHLPSYGPVRSLFQSFFGNTEIGAIQFKGEACYNTKEFYISGATSSMSGHLVTGVLTLIGVIIVAL